jgi:hypothetical protein
MHLGQPRHAPRVTLADSGPAFVLSVLVPLQRARQVPLAPHVPAPLEKMTLGQMVVMLGIFLAPTISANSGAL